MKRLLLVVFISLFASCATTKHVVPIDPKITQVEPAVKSTTKSLNTAIDNTRSALDSANKLVKQISDLQNNPKSEFTLQDIKNTADNQVLSLQKSFTSINSDLKADLFDLQTKALIIQNQVQSLSTTVELLSKEREVITTQKIELATKLDIEQKIAAKWRWISFGSMLLIITAVLIKVYMMFVGGGLLSKLW
jgi:chromosome segregation ATPase